MTGSPKRCSSPQRCRFGTVVRALFALAVCGSAGDAFAGSLAARVVVDFESSGYSDFEDLGSKVLTNNGFTITASDANWEGFSSGTGYCHNASAGCVAMPDTPGHAETITIRPVSGVRFKFTSFFIGNHGAGGGVAKVEGFRNGSATPVATLSSGFPAGGDVSAVNAVITLDTGFQDVDSIVITSNSTVGFYDVFDDFVFDPPVRVPLLTTNAATGISTTGATLNGTVDDNTATTTVSFDYGTTASYGTNTGATTGGTVTAGTGPTAAALTLSGLTCGTTYHFRIKGINSYGTAFGSDASFSTTKCAQTISWSAQASRTYSPGGTFSISPVATATSGLGVSYSSLTTSVCTVSGTTVTMVSAGTCTLAADQAGNATYAAAPQVTQGVSIAKASQALTWSAQANQTFSAGGTFAINPTATATSGLAVSYSSLTTSVCTVSGTTVSIVAAGTCTLAADQAGNANYNAATRATQSLSINPANQTITWNAQANQTFSSGGTFAISPVATATSGLAVSYSSLTTSVCTVSGTTVSIVAAGTCTLAADQAGNANYNAAARVTQGVSIGKANQTIAWNAQANQTFSAGGTFAISPVATATSGLTVSYSSLTTSVCTVSGTTVTIVTTGTCTLAADQAGNANYNAAARVTQGVSIGKANQTLAWSAQADQTFSASGTFAISPVATATSGLAVSYSSLTTSVCTVSGTTVSVVAVGTCTLAADQSGNANYNAATRVTQSLSIGKANQTLTWNAQADQTYSPGGTFAINPVATATSGLAVSYSSLTTSVCTVSGTTVSIVAVGTCTLAADQAGDASYNAATRVTQSVSVSKANQTLTWNAQADQTFSPGGMFAISPVATATSGLAVSYSSLTASVCTVSGTTVSIVAAGTCTLAADQSGDASYNAAAQVTQSLTIGKASQTLTWNAQASQTWSAGGTFAIDPVATATSGLAVSYSSLTTSVCTVSGTTVTIVAVGTCTLAADQGGDAGYNAAVQATQSLDIGKASQTLTWGAQAGQTWSAGGTFAIDPVAMATSGLAVSYSSLTPSVCTVSGTTVTIVAVGTCTLAADQAGDASYDAAPQVTQSLDIGKASQTIVFDAQADQTFDAGGTFVIDPEATATSGLAVSYSSLTPSVCTVSGTTVTIVAAGTCTLAADQAGDAGYEAAPQVTQSLGIGKASQTIAFDAQADQLFTAGGTFAIDPEATATSGLPVSYSSLTPSVCTVSGTTVTMLAVGACTLAADQAGDAGYEAAPQATQNVRIDSKPATRSGGCAVGGSGAPDGSLILAALLFAGWAMKRRSRVVRA